jgi:hypothetical protein
MLETGSPITRKVALGAFVGNAPVMRPDYLGLWPWTGCCNGQTFNRLTQCCCKGAIVAKSAQVGTGVRVCTKGGTPFGDDTLFPDHQWIEIDTTSYGFWPRGFPFGHYGQVQEPDPYAGSGHCREVKVTACDYDIAEFRHRVHEFWGLEAAYPGVYIYGIRDCRHVSNASVNYATMAARGSGCSLP